MKLNNVKNLKGSILIILMSLCFVFIFTACSENKKDMSANESQTTLDIALTETEESNSETNTSDKTIVNLIDKDREGNSITLPDEIDKIISMGPSNTEILTVLGFADKIVAVDTYSNNIDGIAADVTMFDMMEPDGEQIISLQPDIIFVSGMSKVVGDDPLKAVSDAGICIIYIPSSTSIEGIKEDIRFVADVMGVTKKGNEIVSDMEKEIDAIKTIGDTITDKKTVYFEISAAPYMYSFGSGVFLDEMIGIIGAKNAFSEIESWASIADEQIFAVNPDVILTSVNYIDNPTDEIKSRTGWEEITAVKNDAVYYINSDASNRPNQNIITALKEMAKSVYPELY